MKEIKKIKKIKKSKLTKNKLKVSLIILCCLQNGWLVAMPRTVLPETSAIAMSATVTGHNQIASAKTWHLTEKQLQKYQWLMQNTPSGKWYRQLDPAEVLALNATNSIEMLKYAKIEAELMHHRVTQELRFNILYAKAYQQLYPNEKPIEKNRLQNSVGTTLQSGDHIWLFVNPSMPLGKFIYERLYKKIQTVPHTTLDIYFVGSHLTDKVIETWAMQSGVMPENLDKQVTLNYGNRRFQEVAAGKELPLPFVGILHQQMFQAVALTSVL